MTLRVAIAGASGRMGHALLQAVHEADDVDVSAALDRAGAPSIGSDAGAPIGVALGVPVTADIAAAVAASDILIDFTRPEGSLVHLAACRDSRKKLVLGTTGFSDAQKQAIAAASRDIAIVFAPNMSIGVNVLFKLLDLAASVLADDYDAEIIEAHHRHKVDAPSGTALRMGEVIAKAWGKPLADLAVYAREGQTGERRAGSIGFATLRGGDIVGDHTALFAGTGERVEISHRATSRMTFAMGALRAARFLSTHETGLFDMQDVLGLR